MKYKVKGENNMVRDSLSKAILFTDSEETRAYEVRKKQLQSKNSEINTLKQEVAELRKLVLELIERQENR